MPISPYLRTKLINMKNFYHVCFTSHREAPFRQEEDLGILFNCMALAAFSTGTDILVDTTMSTHQHAAVFCETPGPWVRSSRCAYTRYFNRKYSRTGPLGDPGYFALRLDGFRHMEIALSYILRNPLHHGQAATPFGTVHSTIHELFSKDFCRPEPGSLISNRSLIQSFLPRRAEFPDSYQMNASGIFTRGSVEQIRQAEAFFVTPRNFLYDMNRLSREDWLMIQDEDQSTAERITLGTMEPMSGTEDVARMLVNESGRNARKGSYSDLDVCALIDNGFLPKYKKASVYQLSESQKDLIARDLNADRKVSKKQINRCLYFYDKL